MLQVQTTLRAGQVGSRLRMSVQIEGGEVLAATRVGAMLNTDKLPDRDDATVFTVRFADSYAKLLSAETRFATFLPVRVAVYGKGDGAVLEAESPLEWCRMIGRSELEPAALLLERVLRRAMENSAKRPFDSSADNVATEDLVNMRAAVPQRVDARGTKVEELAGTGVHDAAGG